MKIAVIGIQGSGKTTLIKNKLITNGNNFLVHDLHDEYGDISVPRIKVKGLINELPLKLKEHVFNNSNITHVIDSPEVYGPLNSDFTKKVDYSWIGEMLEEKSFIITVNSIKIYNEMGFNKLDKIYYFRTIENNELQNKFIKENSNIIEEQEKINN